jgi:ABC-type cobalamin/Fe3+-siderophores transport system ATPase subunit
MTMLAYEAVAFSYGSAPFLQDLSWAVRSGELVGLIGANGSGKSTMLRLAAGMLVPARGTIQLLGRPLGSWRAKERAQVLGYLPQALEASLPFRVGELVAMGAAAGRHGAVSTAAVLATVGLSGQEATPLGRLSGGERRRAFLAMALAQGGSVLLLDEPLAGLDLRFQYELLDLLQALCRERGMAIVLSLHDLLLARELDRLLVIGDGAVLADGRPDAVLKPDLIRRTFSLRRPVAWLDGL